MGLMLQEDQTVSKRAVERLEEPDRLSVREQLAASFNLQNTVASAIEDGSFPDDPFNPNFDPADHLRPEERIIADRFANADSIQDMDVTRERMTREKAARRAVGEGPLPALLSDSIAIFADPTTFLPAAGALRGGTLTSRLLGGMAGGAADVAVSEAALQATQVDRSMEETMTSVLLGGAFGFGIAGGVAGAAARRARKKIEADAVRDFTALAKQSYPDDFELPPGWRVKPGEPPARDTAQATGAAPTPRNPADSLIEKPTRAFVKNALARLGKGGLAAPSVEVMVSRFSRARETMLRLAETGIVTEGNVKGFASPVAVSTKIKRYDTYYAGMGKTFKNAWRQHRKAKGSLTYGQFLDEVGRADRRGDVHRDPNVQKASQWMRANVFDPPKNDAIALGMLPDDVTPKTAPSYFTRVFNREKIKARRRDFKKITTDWLHGLQESRRRDVLRVAGEREARRAEVAGERELAGQTATRAGEEAAEFRRGFEGFEIDRASDQARTQAFEEVDRASESLAAVQDDISTIRERAGKASAAADALVGLVRRFDVADERVAAQLDELTSLRDIKSGLRDTIKETRARRGKLDLPRTEVTTRTGKKVTHRGPMDLVTWLRTQGGLVDQASELASRDLDKLNRRGVEFAGRDRLFGSLVDEGGLPLDDAALRAWEEGYLPGEGRPSADDLLAAIDSTVRAKNDFDGRVWRQQDLDLVDQLATRRLGGEDAELRLAARGDAEAELGRVADEIRRVQRDLGKQRAFTEALGPASGRFERVTTQLDELQGTLDELEATRAARRQKADDLEQALKGSERELKADVRAQLSEARAFRDAAQRAERTQQRAMRQGERLSRTIEALDRRLARGRNAALDLADTDTIDDAADQLIDTILGAPAGRTDFLQVPIARGPLKERTFLIPDEQIEEFLENNALDIGTRYIRTMASDLELTREFGSPDMRNQIREIQDEVNAAADLAKTEAESKAILEEGERVITLLDGVNQYTRNLYNTGGEYLGIKKIGRIARNVNYLRLMGRVVLSSIPDAGRMVAEGGLARAFATPVLDAMTGFKGIRLARQEAQEAGTALDIVLSQRLRTFADLGEQYVSESKFSRALGGASNVYGNLTLLNPWNEVMKSWASAMISTRILKTADKIAKGKKLTRVETFKLARAGISTDMAKKIAAQSDHWDKQGLILLGNTNAWTDNSAREAFRNALLADVDRTIITPGVADAPLWTGTEVGKMIFQFKRFSMASTQRMLLSSLQQRDLTVLNSIMVMVGLGMLGTGLRDIFRDPEVGVKDRSARQWIADGIDRSGVLSLFIEMDNIAEKATGVSIQGAVTGAGETSRFRTRDVIGQVLGPSAGLLEDTTKALHSFTDGQATEQDLQRLQKLFPGQNHLVLGELANRVSKGIAEGANLPERPERRAN